MGTVMAVRYRYWWAQGATARTTTSRRLSRLPSSC